MDKHTQTIRRQIATPKISLKEKFDTLKIKFIDDFESMKESFFFPKINLFKMEILQPNANVSESLIHHKG